MSSISKIEISTKKSIGKLSFSPKPSELIDLIGFEELTIQPQHSDMLIELNWFRRNPFNKMIIAQAFSENREIISYDNQFKDYDLRLI